MPTKLQDILTSGVSEDVRPLDEGTYFDDAEYVMRQIGILEGELGTTISAFNSSI